MTKVCSKCKMEKEVDFYYKDKGGVLGFRSSCKQCDIDRVSNYNYKNIDQRRRIQKKYRESNRSTVNADRQRYYYSNKELINQKYKTRKLVDSSFKLAGNLRRRLCVAVKNGQKTGSAIADLGCSIIELKKHLKSQFQPGMTWRNYDRDGWHIDHVVALSLFDLSDREQMLKACHYTNLQPLWAKDNIKKSNR